MPDKTENFRRVYKLFRQRQKEDEFITCDEVEQITEWTQSTVKTYRTKKWKPFITQIKKGGFKINLGAHTEDSFIRMMSQNQNISENYFRPIFPDEVERLIHKARESALLAVDVYNRPGTEFRISGYVVMMIIAWTALFHAIFELKGIHYYYENKDNIRTKVNREERTWDLSRCLKAAQGTETIPLSTAEIRNIELFIGLRNKIEHRYIPKLDLYIFGECQALLLNFERRLVEYFTDYYSLQDSLSFPLQMISTIYPQKVDAMKNVQKRYYDELKDYISDFRNNLSDDILNDESYSFRIFLIPKISNHRSSSDMSIEFIPLDEKNKGMIEEINKNIVAIKEKYIPVVNCGKYKPKDVIRVLLEKYGLSITMYEHTQAWRHFQVRGKGKNSRCKTEYCQYDVAHGDYVYTDKWIDKLRETYQNNQYF